VHGARDGIPPGVVKFRYGNRPFSVTGLDGQLVAADRSEPRGRHTDKLRSFDQFHGVEGFARDDDAALRFAEKQRVEALGFERGKVQWR
jgi:hypothetical protein